MCRHGNKRIAMETGYVTTKTDGVAMGTDRVNSGKDAHRVSMETDRVTADETGGVRVKRKAFTVAVCPVPIPSSLGSFVLTGQPRRLDVGILGRDPMSEGLASALAACQIHANDNQIHYRHGHGCD